MPKDKRMKGGVRALDMARLNSVYREPVYFFKKTKTQTRALVPSLCGCATSIVEHL